MKKCLMACLVAFGMNVLAQTQISPFVVGQNANLTKAVGTKTNAGGRLDNYWQKTGPYQDTNYVGYSHATIIRYGGNLLEENAQLDGTLTISSSNISRVVNDYIEKALAIFANDLEPALTIPMHPSSDENALPNASDTLFTIIGGQAANFVRAINDSLQAKVGKVCRYWIYSNEPQLNGIHSYTNADAPKRIYRYISAMHGAAMSVWQSTWTSSVSGPTATPQFIGPELAGLDNYDHQNGLDKLTEQLLGVFSPINPSLAAQYSIKPFITHFSWHDYPYNNQQTVSGDFPAPTRSNVIRSVANPIVVSGFTWSTKSLPQQINDVKGWLGTGSPIKLAITEYNISHINRVSNGTVTPAYDATYKNSDSLHRQGANSFLAAQFNAEYMSYCMENGVDIVNMWSALEGCGSCTEQPNYRTNVGYLNVDPSKFGGYGRKKPSYYSFQMMGLFRGRFYRGTSKSFSQYDTTAIYAQYQNGVKVFGAVEAAGIRIVCINHTDSAFDYRVMFKNSAGNANGRATFNFTAMTGDAYLSGFSSPANDAYNSADVIPANSIVLLQFDCHGGFMTQRNYSYAMADRNAGPQLRVVGPIVLNYDLLNCGDPRGDGISGTIPSTVFTKDTIYITGDVPLNPGADVTFDSCLVVFSPGTGLHGEEGNVIELKNTVMVGCNQSDWQGITMVGYNLPSEKFSMQNSFIVGALHPVKLTRIPNIFINQSVMVSGLTAIELNQCPQNFIITKNILALYENAAIKTSNTSSLHKAFITQNQMWEVFEGLHSENDVLDSLTYGCNDHRFSSAGVYALNSTIANQGSSMVSAGNNFYNINSAEPTDYWNQTGGNNPTYYYGPINAIEFGYYSPMTITTNTALTDPLCAMLFVNDCPEWQLPLSIKKKGTIVPEMTVYPNPSSGDFTLEIIDNNEKYLVSVYDIMGRLLESREVDFSTESSVKFEIKTRGLYIINLSNEKNRITKKVIVN